MLYGTIVNVICIVIGSLLGLLLTKLHERFKEIIMQGIGLTVILIGLQMSLQTNEVIVVLLSVVFGGLIGELLTLEALLEKIGTWIARKFNNTNQSTVNIGQGFITASLIFVVGAMAIIGAMNSGLRGNHELLLTKSILDGFTSLVLSSVLGIGVVFAAFPVLLFQGMVTLMATKIEAIIPPAMFQSVIDEITVVGGLMIVAIGLNLLKITSIRVTNMLPALPLVVIILYIRYLF